MDHLFCCYCQKLWIGFFRVISPPWGRRIAPEGASAVYCVLRIGAVGLRCQAIIKARTSSSFAVARQVQLSAAP